ncbi:hypothetical protein F0U61_14595 [Archangium violaceum]|uniref:hypothetical protein n=1 Tax=Archangium violaceum TaxID=83451 RepID=UPI002B31B5F4|nr:hypothetical protein F0U61_14595 [Archangium violaceum]
MSQMDVFRENARFAISELRDGLHEPLTSEQQQKLLYLLSGHHRVAGICTLLTEADVPGFRQELVRSAEARIQLLKLGAGQPPTHVQATSHVGSFFDAIAAGADALALEIARLSPVRWLGGEEWEEDFRYARFLHVLLLEGLRPSPEVETALSAFQHADEGGERPSPRRLLCEAFFSREQKAFDLAFDDLLHERELEALEREKSGPLSHPARHHTEKHVFIEGLALLHLAHSCGLKTRPEYPMVPGIARR